MGLLLKQIERIFFIVINIIFGFSIVGYCLFLLMLFTPLFQNFFPLKRELTDEVLMNYALGAFFIYFLYIIVKIFIFPILYTLKTVMPNTHYFLSRIVEDKVFRKKVLTYAILLDLVYFLICVIFNWKHNGIKDAINIYVSLGGGILPCYLVFLLCQKLLGRKKILKNSL